MARIKYFSLLAKFSLFLFFFLQTSYRTYIHLYINISAREMQLDMLTNLTNESSI